MLRRRLVGHIGRKSYPASTLCPIWRAVREAMLDVDEFAAGLGIGRSQEESSVRGHHSGVPVHCPRLIIIRGASQREKDDCDDR